MLNPLSLPSNPPASPLYADAVLAGGGVRGIAHVGALAVAEARGYQWQNIAGTSAGAIVAALMAAGYAATDLYSIMREIDFRRFVSDKGWNVPWLRETFNMLTRGGLHTGHYIEEFLREKLRPKGKVKFGDLVIPGRAHLPKDSRFRYRLVVIASDISNGRMLRLPQDSLRYGQDPDDMDIALAVRMSASIPFFFTPICQRYNGHPCCIVDGGLLSNFPISTFDVATEPQHPTFGLHLVDSPNTPSDGRVSCPVEPTRTIFQFSRALLNTMLKAHDRLYMDDHAYVRTIAIPVNGIQGTNFNLTAQQAEQLYTNGKAAAETFFSTWNFDAYKATYRGNLPQKSRREHLREHMQRNLPL